MKKLSKYLLERLASSYKGASYKLDPDFSQTALFSLATRRGVGLLRCVLRGIAIRPSRLLFIGGNVELRNRKYIHFSKGVTVGKHVTIDGLSREGVVIGKSVNIGPFSTLEASGSITNLGKGIRIGERSGIGGYSYIGGAGGVDIGNDVIMGQYVSFHPENHIFERDDLPIRLQGVTRQGIVIEDDCWIGAKVTFLDGAHVGKGCVIAAGAVVRGYIPPFSVAAGVPAKVVKSRDTRSWKK